MPDQAPELLTDDRLREIADTGGRSVPPEVIEAMARNLLATRRHLDGARAAVERLTVRVGDRPADVGGEGQK